MKQRRVDTELRQGLEFGAACQVAPPGSERRCIVTRRVLPARQLLALSQFDGQVVVGRAHRGRGAYVSIEREVLRRLDPRGLSRAFRRRIDAFDCPTFLAATHITARTKTLERIGLARGAGQVEFGIDASLSSPADASLFYACDLAASSVERLAQASNGDRTAMKFVLGEALGRAAGAGWVGALVISSGRLADEASYWWRVWYESATREEDAL